ncbi:conserved hypothetical protein [Talaromyces stipitatus ATCC 10500]|uniref:Uncharacterized protein n=1 Tax=Talaromyces stipitatus (strain ATCC 10500 / CBS 375.48 / QM 6759 / NRRL 1006) TaxID=441959 RepID=B8MIP0_TALSN|nr:uncharacterized protein TSTA_045880 [Talaromyces stipitatus ATCC 10500]EED15132.1 conserved hypothetical protein [Talaromyces stipitatus ATCC 10500]
MHTPIQNGFYFYLRLSSILLFTQFAAANVEKTVFVAPLPWSMPTENSAIDDLGLDRLSPTDFMLRTNLNASFPTDDRPYGTESWFYLEELNPGQRYEVRICWMATQPTFFSLTTYPLQEVIPSQSLLPSLLNFSDARLAGTSLPSSSRPSIDREDHLVPHAAESSDSYLALKPAKARHQHTSRLRRSRSSLEREQDPLALSSHAESVLFLRIWAAADYYTTNATLMANVPPVMVDIILDPFLWNVFPRSLIPTASYTVVIAVIAYFVGGVLATFLSDAVTTATRKGEAARNDVGVEEVENKKRL